MTREYRNRGKGLRDRVTLEREGGSEGARE